MPKKNKHLVVSKDVKHSIERIKEEKGFSNNNKALRFALIETGCFKIHPDNQVDQFQTAKQLQEEQNQEDQEVD